VTRAERERLRALAEQATPGPWDTDDADINAVFGPSSAVVARTYGWERTGEARGERCRANAHYIAALSPSVVLSLLAALDAGERKLEDISHVAEDFADPDLAHDDPVYAVSIMAGIIRAAQPEEPADV
jgi:hypothetical protein